MENTQTQIKILNTAESLIQAYGFNDFSYKDISKIVGIKNASIHYYYPKKENLVVAVIKWHIHKFVVELNKIRSNIQATPKTKLTELLDLIINVTYANDNKMCLAGILAANIKSLPQTIIIEIKNFFSFLLEWVEDVASPHFLTKNNTNFAMQLIIQIEGGLLLARTYDNEQFLTVIKDFLNDKLD